MRTAKWGELLLILPSALLLGAMTLSLLFLPGSSFSETENRALSRFPSLEWRSLLTGEFSDGLHRFVSDQLPLRSRFVALSSYAELALGKGEVGGVLIGKKGYLIPREEGSDPAILSANLSALQAFSDASPTPTSVFLVPRHADVLSDLFPNGFSNDRSAWVADTVRASSLSPLFPVVEWQGRAEYYYKTDHHLTTEGAYAVYQLLGESLGYTPLEESYFEKEVVSHNFRGTSDSKIGGIAPAKDTVTLYRYPNDERFSVSRDGDTGEMGQGFYRRSALAGKDHYSVFLGGNYAHLRITDPSDREKPRLLLIKDSYANALIPFLAIHFDLTVLDPRYRSDVNAHISSAYDRVLILQGLGTLATDPSLSRLLSPS